LPPHFNCLTLNNRVRINELCAYHLDYRDIVPVMTEVWSRPIQHDAHDGGDIDIFADGTAFGYAQVSSGMIHLHLWRTELDRYTGTSIPAPISMKVRHIVTSYPLNHPKLR
jgi:hypothetical protein